MSRTPCYQERLHAGEFEQTHSLYRLRGAARSAPPHVVYDDSPCPHPDCGEQLKAIDFRLEAFGRAVYDALVKAWWDDVGFAGRCPKCGQWIHFTIRGKRAINDEQAAALPQLPSNWASEAVTL
jgi:hypothetical protein